MHGVVLRSTLDTNSTHRVPPRPGCYPVRSAISVDSATVIILVVATTIDGCRRVLDVVRGGEWGFGAAEEGGGKHEANRPPTGFVIRGVSVPRGRAMVGRAEED